MTQQDFEKAPESYSEYEKWAHQGESPELPANTKPDAPVEATPDPEAETEPNSEAEDNDQEQPNKGKGGFQRRIDKLTAKVRELEGTLANSQRPVQQQPTGDAPPKPQSADKPKEGDFQTWEAYNDALLEWKLDERDRARAARYAREQAQQAEAKVHQDWSSRLEAFQKATPDFAEVVAEANVPLPPAMREAILTSEHGPEVAYHLAKHTDEAQRIAGLSPVAQVRELGRLEAQFVEKQQPDHTEKPKAARTPNPIKPVSAGTKDVPRLDGENTSYDEYERLRMAQLQRGLRFRGQ